LTQKSFYLCSIISKKQKRNDSYVDLCLCWKAPLCNPSTIYSSNQFSTQSSEESFIRGERALHQVLLFDIFLKVDRLRLSLETHTAKPREFECRPDAFMRRDDASAP